MKKYLSFLFIALFLFGVFGSALAQRELEVDYPKLPGTEVVPQTVEGTALPDYVKYIFNFAIALVGLVAFVSVVIGGIRWLTSGGNPMKLSDSRDQIFSSFLGLVILLASYLILTTINPQLIIFEVAELTKLGEKPAPGVWLCKKEIANFKNFDAYKDQPEKLEQLKKEVGENCFNPGAVSNFPVGFEDKVVYAYVIESGGITYGAVIQSEKNFKGECQVVLREGPVSPKGASVIPFVRSFSPSGQGVSLYEKTDFNEGVSGKRWPSSGGYTNLAKQIINANPAYSMKMDNPNHYVAVLYDDNSNKCQVFDDSDRNLQDNYVGDFCGWWLWRDPCVGAVQVIGGQVIGTLPY